MKVSTRLGLGFGAVLVLMIVVAAIGLTRLNGVNHQLQVLSDDRVPKIITASDWLFRLMETARHTRNMLILDDPEKIKAEIAAVHDDRRVRKEYMDQLQATVVTPSGKASLQEVIDARTAYVPTEDAYLKLVESGDMAGAKTYLLQTMRPSQLVYVAKVRHFIEVQKKTIDAVREEAHAEYSSGRMLIIATGLIAMLVAAVSGWILTRSLVRQIGAEPSYVVEAADQIAAGNLAADISTQPGDTSSILHSMKQMRDSLSAIVGNVRAGTDTMATAASEIAAGNQDLSSRTEQQASSLEETASSMEEMTSTVKQNADNARQANAMAASASEVALKGGQVVSQVVDTMADINASSRKIVDIISVIDGIAFQTNILALNAAVEAARAGEQGRGFAVVATEVRNLAQRSAAAAKEIKQLIGDSVEKVDHGSKLVGEAGATMDDIVASVQRVADILNDIGAASLEQESGIEQINEAISQMDTVTQQNAALVEEASASAEAMQEQSVKLAQMVSVFKLQAGLAAAAPAAAPAPRMVHSAPAARPVKAPVQRAKLVANSDVASSDWEQF